MAADDCAVEVVRDDAEATHLRINLCNQKLTSTANLLLLGLDRAPGTASRKDYSLRVKLNTGAAVGFEVINNDELFAVVNHLAKSNGRPSRTHAACPRATLISRISSAMRSSFFRMSSAS